MANLQRIAIVRRAGDGLVQIAAVTDIAANLQLLQSFGVPVDVHHESAPSRHAARIARQLARRFARGAIDGGPWYAIDFAEARRALGEYDLDTGERTAADEIALHSTVYVEGTGIGKVTGFSGCGRVEVTFDRFKPASLVVLAPRGRVTVAA